MFSRNKVSGTPKSRFSRAFGSTLDRFSSNNVDPSGIGHNSLSFLWHSIIQPFLRNCINYICLISTIIYILLIPFVIAFIDYFGYLWKVFLFSYLFDVIFLLDFLASFRTTYLDEIGREQYDTKELALRYVKSRNFIFDLLTILPLELIGLSFPRRFFVLFKANKIFKLYPIFNRITLQRSNYMRIFELILAFAIVGHYWGCILWLIGDIQDPSSLPPNQAPWTMTYDFLSVGADLKTHYITSLYWAITTMTTVGFGDLTPKTNLERLYTIFVMLISATLYATIFGNINLLIQNSDRVKQRYRDIQDNFNEFFSSNGVNPDIRKRITDYLHHQWNTHKGMMQSNIFEFLPFTLRSELAMSVHNELVRSVPMFQRAEPGFIKQIVLHLKPEVCAPNDFIIRAGDLGKEMYFIKKGSVRLLAGDEYSSEITKLGQGSFFGEIALLTGEKRTLSVQAVTYCDLFTLSREDFDAVAADYPESLKPMLRIAQKRASAFQKAEDKKLSNLTKQRSLSNFEDIPTSPDSNTDNCNTNIASEKLELTKDSFEMNFPRRGLIKRNESLIDFRSLHLRPNSNNEQINELQSELTTLKTDFEIYVQQSDQNQKILIDHLASLTSLIQRQVQVEEKDAIPSSSPLRGVSTPPHNLNPPRGSNTTNVNITDSYTNIVSSLLATTQEKNSPKTRRTPKS